MLKTAVLNGNVRIIIQSRTCVIDDRLISDHITYRSFDQTDQIVIPSVRQ